MDTLRAADVLLVNEIPGMREMSVPSKLTSYYASGRPVLAATDIRSVTAEELLLSGAGLRVDPGQPAALLRAAMSLGNDRESAQAFGRAGRAFLEAHLTETAALDRFELWIDSLLRARPAAS